MPVRSPRPPRYRLHKPSGQAVVTLTGRDFYLGRYGTDESRTEYRRLTAEWLANQKAPLSPKGFGAADLTFNEFILSYLRYADGYYRKNGKTTSEPVNIKLALRPLRELYGHTLAKE